MGFFTCISSWFSFRETVKLYFFYISVSFLNPCFLVNCRWVERCSWGTNGNQSWPFTNSGHPWKGRGLWSTTQHVQETPQWAGQRGAAWRHGSTAGSQWGAEGQTHRNPNWTAAGENQGLNLELLTVYTTPFQMYYFVSVLCSLIQSGNGFSAAGLLLMLTSFPSVYLKDFFSLEFSLCVVTSFAYVTTIAF